MSERDYFLGFSVFPGIGPGRFQSLLSTFGSAKTAWEAPASEVRDVLKDKLTEDFVTFREGFDIDDYKRILLRKEVSFITLQDKEYPENLRDLENPPFVLYCKGDRDILRANEESREELEDDRSTGSSRLRSSVEELRSNNNKIIAIVGTRKMTSYGKTITESFTRELVEEGFVVVSGLALGVDAIAHKTTVDNGGKTIAVLGCGVDCCYPSSNQGLYSQILETGGAIISEYPLSASPNKGSFPSRNRIIAALSDAVLVTEGAEDSGSLITALKALELRRTVFAIPGPVTSSLSRGPLTLIRKGAKLVTSGNEILQELGVKGDKRDKGDRRRVVGETEEEQKVIDCLLHESLSFDEIIQKANIATDTLGTVLSLMEMKGLILLVNNSYSLKE